MKKLSDDTSIFATRIGVLAVVFLLLTVLLTIGFLPEQTSTSADLTLNDYIYPVGIAMLLAGLTVFVMNVLLFDDSRAGERREKPWWAYPLAAGLLGLYCMLLAYIKMGIWPVGERSVMTVDMHHQYAPLLAHLKNVDSPLFSFNIGLGTSFLPLFGYYLTSPFNLLFLFMPSLEYLNEFVLIITLLKNALCAFAFALCIQYIYRRRDITVVFPAIMYSLMSFLVAYSWNIMWLDCLFMLPLVIMAFERMMREGKYLLYILSLGYTLYANYYIGFMICLFLVLYWIVYAVREKRPAQNYGKSFVRFGVGSLLGGGLAMFLLLPVYMALGDTSAAGGGLPELTSSIDLFDLLGRHLYEVSQTIRSGKDGVPNLPNIYCGLLAVVLLPIYATLKKIPLRRRLAYLGLLAVLAVSFTLNQFNLIWHGLHAPNDLPYRFSFLYSFVLLLIAVQTLGHLRELKLGQIGGTVAGLILYLIIEERFGKDDYGFISIYVSLLLIVIYGLILLLAVKTKLAGRVIASLLLLVVVAEMTLNGGASFVALHGNEYFTARQHYAANDTTKALEKGVATIKSMAALDPTTLFYRMEFFPRRTTVDPAMYNYRGFSVFASTNPKRVTTFMGRLGYANNGVNSHLYKSYSPVTDALFGIEYIMMPEYVGDSWDLLTYKDTVTEGNDTYYIYKSSAVLPIGYQVNSSIRDWLPIQYDPVTTQNQLYTALTGRETELYTPAELSADSGGSVTPGMTSFRKDGDGSASFSATVAKTGQVLVYVDCGAASSINVSGASGDSGAVTNETIKPREPYMLNLGYLKKGEVVTVSISSSDTCTGNIYVQTLNTDVLEDRLAQLRDGGLRLDSFSETNIKGTVTAESDGVFLTSIPYDRGWTVLVDGKKVSAIDYKELGLVTVDADTGKEKESNVGINALLCFDLAAGTHTIELRYMTPGLLPGIAVSAASLVLLILFLILLRRQKLAAVSGGGPLSLLSGSLEAPRLPDSTAEAAPLLPSAQTESYPAKPEMYPARPEMYPAKPEMHTDEFSVYAADAWTSPPAAPTAAPSAFDGPSGGAPSYTPTDGPVQPIFPPGVKMAPDDAARAASPFNASPWTHTLAEPKADVPAVPAAPPPFDGFPPAEPPVVSSAPNAFHDPLDMPFLSTLADKSPASPDGSGIDRRKTPPRVKASDFKFLDETPADDKPVGGNENDHDPHAGI